jgi:hypothetical protein
MGPFRFDLTRGRTTRPFAARGARRSRTFPDYPRGLEQSIVQGNGKTAGGRSARSSTRPDRAGRATPGTDRLPTAQAGVPGRGGGAEKRSKTPFRGGKSGPHNRHNLRN